MGNAVLLAAMLSGLATDGSACPENFDESDHLMDVCADYLDDTAAYSATWLGSLSPRPAEQQVAVFRYEGKWFVRVAGYRWKPGTSLVEYRRNEIQISEEDSDAIAALMSDAKLKELSSIKYYGSDYVFCTDGASFRLDMARAGQRKEVAQHSCAGKTEINRVMSEFRNLALKYDPEFDGMLTGLKN